MNTTTKRITVAAITGSVALGGLLLAGGTANATTPGTPSNTPCTPSDVNVSVAPDPTHSAGQEAFVITYTATSPTTNCELVGTPTNVSFVAGGQGSSSNTTVTPDAPGSAPAPVNLRDGQPAQSYILQSADAAPTFSPDALNMSLPTGPDGYSTTVAWPANAPLKGTTAEVTAVAPVQGS
jgi:hypothetical protein